MYSSQDARGSLVVNLGYTITSFITSFSKETKKDMFFVYCELKHMDTVYPDGVLHHLLNLWEYIFLCYHHILVTSDLDYFEEIIYSGLYNGFVHKTICGYTVYVMNCT